MNFLNIAKRFRNFNKDEDGAVTVDWVVLTAAIVGLGLLVMAAIRPAITGLADKISDAVEQTEVGTGG